MFVKTLDNYTVLETLGSGGHAIVVKVRSESSEIFAAKILSDLSEKYREGQIESFMDEVHAMQSINHPLVLPLIHFNPNGRLTTSKGTREVAYMITPFCPNGNLWDLIREQGGFSEVHCRFYFKQIVEAVEACHLSGFCHRDIKPDNVLLDENCNIKLGDLGFSYNLLGRREDGFMRTRAGTLYAMAPEILARVEYKGEPADVFSLGVLLVGMLSMNQPFLSATMSDQFYNLFNNQREKYWIAFSRSLKKPITDSFKQLVEGLLLHSPSHRWTIPQIKNSEWYNGPTEGPLCRNFRLREPSQPLPPEKKQILKGYRSDEDYKTSSLFNDDYLIPEISMEEFESLKYSKILTQLEPNDVIVGIGLMFRLHDLNFKPVNERMKIRMRVGEVDVKFRFYWVEGSLGIYLVKMGGSEFEFREVFGEVERIIEMIS